MMREAVGSLCRYININQRQRQSQCQGATLQGVRAEAGPGQPVPELPFVPAPRAPGPQAQRGRTEQPTRPPPAGPAPRDHSALWTKELLLATNKATVAGDFYFEPKSGCHRNILQEATTSNKSFLGSGI